MSSMRLLALVLPALLLVACGGDEADPVPPKDAPAGPAAAQSSKERGRTEFTEAGHVPGRWYTTSVPEEMWIVFTDGGRYRYSGVVGTTGGGSGRSAPAGVTENVADKFPWTKPHKGSWSFEDGALTLLPDDESIRALLPFEFDQDEGSLNLRVVGRTPQGVQWIVFWQEAESE